jgi:hypothetical protein
MLKVVKIRGESFDLETGAKEPSKALVVSNGFREVDVPVNEKDVMSILQLAAELSEVKTPNMQSVSAKEVVPEMIPRTFEPEVVSPPASTPVVYAVPDNDYQAPPVSSEDRELGEEYDDELTGTSSI